MFLKNISKFTGKHPVGVSFLTKMQGYWKRDSVSVIFQWVSRNFEEQLFLKDTSGTGVCCELREISKNTYFAEHLWATASDFSSFSKSSRPEVFLKGVLRPEACNFIKQETLAQVFSCEFCEISKNTFFVKYLRCVLLKNFIIFPAKKLILKHLWML